MQSLNYHVSDKGDGIGVNKGKWVVRRPIWRSERASALMEQLQQWINDSQREDLRQMSRQNVAWALADIEPATGGEHSEEKVGEDERSSHSPTPEQHSTPVSIDLYHTAAILSPRRTKSSVFTRVASHWMRG